MKVKFSKDYKEFVKEIAGGKSLNFDLEKTIDVIAKIDNGDIFYLASDGTPTSLPRNGYVIIEE